MKRKTDRGRMKFRAFMVCVLSFLVVTGSACFLNREQEKEEKLKAVYAAESTVSRVKSQLNRVSGGVRTGEKYHRVRI